MTGRLSSVDDRFIDEQRHAKGVQVRRKSLILVFSFHDKRFPLCFSIFDCVSHSVTCFFCRSSPFMFCTYHSSSLPKLPLDIVILTSLSLSSQKKK